MENKVIIKDDLNLIKESKILRDLVYYHKDHSLDFNLKSYQDDTGKYVLEVLKTIKGEVNTFRIIEHSITSMLPYVHHMIINMLLVNEVGLKESMRIKTKHLEI